MISKRRKHRGECSNNQARAESVHGRADVTWAMIGRFRGLSKEEIQRRAERNEGQRHAWEQSLGCVCGSGLPILRRIKIAGKWQGFCKKCKP